MGRTGFILIITAILVAAWFVSRAIAGPLIFKTRLQPFRGFWVFDLQMGFGVWASKRRARREISIYVTSKTWPTPLGGADVDPTGGAGPAGRSARISGGNLGMSSSDDRRMPVRAVINRIHSNSSV
jgi:hypothetical protein